MNLCACTHKHIKSNYVCTTRADPHWVCFHKTPQISIELEHPSFMKSDASVPHVYTSVVAEIGTKFGSYLGQNITECLQRSILVSYLQHTAITQTAFCFRWLVFCIFTSFQAIFILFLGPFTFFNAQKTKYLQILTSLMRWIGKLFTIFFFCLQHNIA